jgi:hypothetical protein
VSDIDTVVVDSLKVLDPERPIREADIRNVLPLVAHAQGDDEYVAASVLN